MSLKRANQHIIRDWKRQTSILGQCKDTTVSQLCWSFLNRRMLLLSSPAQSIPPSTQSGAFRSVSRRKQFLEISFRCSSPSSPSSTTRWRATPTRRPKRATPTWSPSQAAGAPWQLAGARRVTRKTPFSARRSCSSSVSSSREAPAYSSRFSSVLHTTPQMSCYKMEKWFKES